MKNIDRLDDCCIRIHSDDGSYLESKTAEANLLYAILEKLEEIRICTIDVENAVEKVVRN